jgi:hypothetical protein
MEKLFMPLVVLRFCCTGTHAALIGSDIDSVLRLALFLPSTIPDYTLAFTVTYNPPTDKLKQACATNSSHGADDSSAAAGAAGGERDSTKARSKLTSYHKQFFDTLQSMALSTTATYEQSKFSIRECVLGVVPHLLQWFLEAIRNRIEASITLALATSTANASSATSTNTLDSASSFRSVQMEFTFFLELLQLLHLDLPGLACNGQKAPTAKAKAKPKAKASSSKATATATTTSTPSTPLAEVAAFECLAKMLHVLQRMHSCKASSDPSGLVRSHLFSTLASILVSLAKALQEQATTPPAHAYILASLHSLCQLDPKSISERLKEIWSTIFVDEQRESSDNHGQLHTRPWHQRLAVQLFRVHTDVRSIPSLMSALLAQLQRTRESPRACLVSQYVINHFADALNHSPVQQLPLVVSQVLACLGTQCQALASDCATCEAPGIYARLCTLEVMLASISRVLQWTESNCREIRHSIASCLEQHLNVAIRTLFVHLTALQAKSSKHRKSRVTYSSGTFVLLIRIHTIIRAIDLRCELVQRSAQTTEDPNDMLPQYLAASAYFATTTAIKSPSAAPSLDQVLALLKALSTDESLHDQQQCLAYYCMVSLSLQRASECRQFLGPTYATKPVTTVCYSRAVE